MTEENNENAVFAVVIREESDIIKGFDWKTTTINNGVPNEVVIMQLKSLLRNFTSNYFSDFNSKLTK